MRVDQVVGVNQRFAPTRASTGPCFSEPMGDDFEIADFETDQIASSHGELPFPI